MRSVSRPVLLAAALALAACSDKSSAQGDPFTPLPDRDPTSDAGPDAAPPDTCNCTAGDHQSASCASGTCVIQCDKGWDDCDADPTNGCEHDVSADPANCGACGRTCAACGTAACTDGACAPKTLASGQTDATGISLDAGHVYWTNRTVSTGAIRRAAKDGTSPEDVITNVSFPTDVVVIDGQYAYYTLATQDGVKRVGLPGVYGPFPPWVTKQDFPGGLVADATGLYWTTNVSFSGAVMRCFNCGTSAQQVVGGLASAGKLAVDTSSVVVAAGDSVVKIDKTGQNQATLAISQLGVVGIASDGKTVFLAKKGQATGSGEIATVPVAGGSVTTLVGSVVPESLALATEHLYFATSAPDKALVRADTSGRTVTLARGLTAPGNVAVDDTCAYFVDGTTIRRVTR